MTELTSLADALQNARNDLLPGLLSWQKRLPDKHELDLHIDFVNGHGILKHWDGVSKKLDHVVLFFMSEVLDGSFRQHAKSRIESLLMDVPLASGAEAKAN